MSEVSRYTVIGNEHTERGRTRSQAVLVGLNNWLEGGIIYSDGKAVGRESRRNHEGGFPVSGWVCVYGASRRKVIILQVRFHRSMCVKSHG